MGSSLSLLVLLSTWTGVLPGVTPRAKVFVLPGHRMVITCEPNQGIAKFWNFDSDVIKNYQFDDTPIHFCEIDDQILITLAIKNDGFKAVALDPKLSLMRELPQQSIYAPSKLRDGWYFIDFAEIWTSRAKYPKMVQIFRTKNSPVDESKSFFKLPSVIRTEKFKYHSVWVFPWNDGHIAFVQGSSCVYILSEKYLAREKLESDRVEMPKEVEVPLDIPGGWVNASPFHKGNTDITSVDELRTKLSEWYGKKTLIHHAWESLYGLTFAYGDQMNVQIAYLTPLLEVKLITNIEGDIIGGKENIYWVKKVQNGEVVIEQIHLP